MDTSHLAAATQDSAAGPRPTPAPALRIATALVWGLACHGLFVVAIAWMVVGLHEGLTTGAGGLSGWGALAANALLVLQFPLLHSFLLAGPGRRLLARLVPFGLGRDLAPTSFGIVASLQLLVAFGLWSPSGVVLFAAQGALRPVFEVAFVASWLFLVKALWDAGLSLQTGFVGWSAVLRGRRPAFGAFPQHGLFRACRQPVYLAFATTLWTGPVLSVDRVALALAWSAYCAVGPLLKEGRYRTWYGDAYRAYQARVPYLLPFRPARQESA
jgi:protein-S-isoprenylcysteine O-methyltransferase Ste14